MSCFAANSTSWQFLHSMCYVYICACSFCISIGYRRLCYRLEYLFDLLEKLVSKLQYILEIKENPSGLLFFLLCQTVIILQIICYADIK